MTNIQQLTLDLMLAHNIDYEEADRRARQVFGAVGSDRPEILVWFDIDKNTPQESSSVVIKFETGITVEAVYVRGSFLNIKDRSAYSTLHIIEWRYDSKAKPHVLNDGWISIYDKYAEEQEICIVYEKYDNRMYLDSPPFDKEVTHWQPLPQPPKEHK